MAFSMFGPGRAVIGKGDEDEAGPLLLFVPASLEAEYMSQALPGSHLHTYMYTGLSPIVAANGCKWITQV